MSESIGATFSLTYLSNSTAGRTATRHPSTMRVLMTVDAVGGVWRYAMELARAVRPMGIETVFAGLGPRPSSAQVAEAKAIGEITWLDAPLDWQVTDQGELDGLRDLLAQAAQAHDVDLLHLNAPSQAWELETDLPVLVASHSCVVSWWEVVRGGPLPQEWQWQKDRNQEGFSRADAIVSPSRSHAALLERCYGTLPNLNVVHNAVNVARAGDVREEVVFAAGRWWDEGKNSRVLDLASRHARWPVCMAGSVSGPDGQEAVIEHARTLGPLSSEEVISCMRRAGIVVSPSLYEPFGLVALEAAHAGCALVLSDIPTYWELWSDAALFFDPREAADLAETINRLIADTALRSEMGRRAARRAELFSPNAQGSATRWLYDAVTDPRASRSVAGV